MSIYKDCDIRGIYETEITAAECYKIGRALATMCPGKILCGGDVRLSTPELKGALMHGDRQPQSAQIQRREIHDRPFSGDPACDRQAAFHRGERQLCRKSGFS